jgi:DNA sulfur modification protein DndB
MSNKTYIPAFEAHVGDWKYYICKMKYAEVDRSVRFAHELGGNRDLSTLIQRGLSDRTEDIMRYLLESEHRFLGSLIVAAWGGMPQYTPLQMEAADGLLMGLDQGFGVLTFDGTHSFFALDGQHRLRAIKDAVSRDPDLGSEDICVLLVLHNDNKDGRERTQRLFTNINRNAKSTTSAENIALDVDDAYAIVTRQLLTNHPFLSEDGRVRVFSRAPSDDGTFRLATKTIPKTDNRAWTSITVLYELVKALAFDVDASVADHTTRPNDQVLAMTYQAVVSRIDRLLDACGDIGSRLEKSNNAKQLRIPKAEGGESHPMMRPLVQQAVARVSSELVAAERLTWDEALTELSTLSWKMEAPPWISVFNVPTGRMITGKDHSDLLYQLLRIHLRPASVEEVRRARRTYKDLLSDAYPVSEEDLRKKIRETRS